MHWKATAGVDKLFSNPGRPGLGVQLNKLLTHNLTLQFPNEDDDEDDIVSVHEDEDGVEPIVQIKKSPSKDHSFSSPGKKSPSRGGDIAPPSAGGNVSSDDDGPADDFFGLNFGNEDDSSSDEEGGSPRKKQKTGGEEGELSDVEEREGETFEDFDNRRWNKRTQTVLNLLKKDLDAAGQVQFFSFAEGSNRKQAASKFYSLLLLKKTETITVSQSAPFSDITVRQGPKYATS